MVRVSTGSEALSPVYSIFQAIGLRFPLDTKKPRGLMRVKTSWCMSFVRRIVIDPRDNNFLALAEVASELLSRCGFRVVLTELTDGAFVDHGSGTSS